MAFLDSLNGNYALVFSGQGTNWRPALEESLALGRIGQQIRETFVSAQEMLTPIGADLLMKAPGVQERLDEVLSGAAALSPLDTHPGVSGVGILLAQLGALLDLEDQGVDCSGLDDTRMVGHSQGILAVELTKAHLAGDTRGVHRIVALSLLIGSAAAFHARLQGATPQGALTPMLSIKGVPVSLIDEAGGHISMNNGAGGVVLSGRIRDLEGIRDRMMEAVNRHNARIEAREIGGAILEAMIVPLKVAAPFHSELLGGAVEQVDAWVKKLNETGASFNADDAHKCAASILTEVGHWPQELDKLRGASIDWVLDMGPSQVVGDMSAPFFEGTGIAVVDASSRSARTQLGLEGTAITGGVNWDDFLPQLIRLPNGHRAVSTAFTRLTGKSPIILPGMTPTTVWPEIVAAAANGGHWAELAGGGQYSEEVFTKNRRELQRLLKPGHTAAFNTMFFDRFMWNLQFGVNKIVPKARKAGAPINAVTIAAGIPELEEAGTLMEELRADGFTHVCLKPGTVDHIHQVLTIARTYTDFTWILQVEDGHSGGHHSWEDLDHLLLETYADIRRTPNVVLAVGGGIGRPEVAARYITGQWAHQHGQKAMPVDAVLVGTAAMATLEARTSTQVKELLVATPGVDGDGWVSRGEVKGGMTSGLSHLDADMHEVENSSAQAARLIHSMGGDVEKITAHREDIIDALNKTAKPYFGDLEEMTYAQWARRLVELSYPWADWTWQDRVLDVFHRIEARLNPHDHGHVNTLFADDHSVDDAPAALEKLLDTYPAAETTTVSPIDAAWFPGLCRKHHKPMPFVPVLDGELAKWWGTDTLWQSHDARFDADQVRIIPGPRSVAGIDRINEPVAELFARFENEVAENVAAMGVEDTAVFARLNDASTPEEYLRSVPNIEWAGNIVDNPAYVMPHSVNVEQYEDGWVLRIRCETPWDSRSSHDAQTYAVREIAIPVNLDAAQSGGVPIVDMRRLSVTAYDLLAGAAGVGTVTVNGDSIVTMPTVTPDEGFGRVNFQFTLTTKLGPAHAQVTGAAMNTQLASIVPDALVGPCWPAIYAALGTAMKDGIPVIEGLVNAVHLDHTVILTPRYENHLPVGQRVDVEARCAELSESSAGRVVRVEVELRVHGETFAYLTERFAIRGRVASSQPPAPAPSLTPEGVEVGVTPRSFIRSVTVQAPADMTAFAHVSGDFNPIHTAPAAARLSGLHAPLVHGMWLSALAQHLIEAEGTSPLSAAPTRGTIRSITTPPMRIARWSYQMHGMVNLGDDVDISVHRVGHVGGAPCLEATCRINGEVVSIGRAELAMPRHAYVYPGQGIQHVGMGMDKMTPNTRAIWKRADQHTRAALGFSIETVVRDNPQEIRIGKETLRHPEGVLHLTQFTQVALATVAYAQTEELKARGVFAQDAVFAGHSLGEYNALAACAQIFPFEKVLEIVFQRGTAMHHLVERDERGKSNYGLGALRPDQMGFDETQVVDYINALSDLSGEFLQIVNFNLAGSQYAIAGTVKGLEILAEDAGRKAAEYGGRRPFMLIPGVDVPFHSAKLIGGVESFRQKLEELIPEDIDVQPLIGRYIPNLVARPFEVSEEFARAIIEVVPSRAVESLLAEGWRSTTDSARVLLIELLAWQFASPVRWIETQDLLLTSRECGGMGVERFIEVGLASSPTLANLASRTLKLPRHRDAVVDVLNVERDETRVYMTDSLQAPSSTTQDDSQPADEVQHASAEQVDAAPGEKTPAATRQVSDTVAVPAVPSHAGTRDTADIPFLPADAITVLLAHSTKVGREQILGSDTIETITNGVSSKRNQLLMDMAAELGIPTIEGALEASIAQLKDTVNTQCASYRPFGPVLTEALTSSTHKLLGSARLSLSDITERVTSVWKLGQGWDSHVKAEILLGTREGESTRGGALAILPTRVTSPQEGHALIDNAVRNVGERLGLHVSLEDNGAGSGGELVDSAALTSLTERILGQDGILARQARMLLNELGAAQPHPTQLSGDDYSELARIVDAELGDGWVKSVEPVFTPAQAVLLDDKWALAREDLARVASGQLAPGDVTVACVRSGPQGEPLAELARWYASHHPDLEEFFSTVAREVTKEPRGEFSDDIALVTGAAPDSIAASLVEKLLEGGAQVIMTASRVDEKRLAFAKDLYRRHGSIGSALWVVPANMASMRDIDALIEWIGSEQKETSGASTVLVKKPWRPTLFFPFAAPRVFGRMGEDAQAAMRQERLLLWSVEHTIAALASLDASADIEHRVHVVLPGSPNRGIFGGDGAYAQSKASFDTIVNKWSVENGWPERITLAHPRIGWVKGTSLMGGNDVLVPAAQRAGIRVFTTEEIAQSLIQLASRTSREAARHTPQEADLTGGLGQSAIDLSELAATAQLMEDNQETSPHEPDTLTIPALPNLVNPKLPESLEWSEVTASLDEQVVIVGIGEVSAWGSGRTRHEAEMSDGDIDLSAAGVMELAWMMGLIHWSDTPAPSWYDTDDQAIAEEDIYDRYRDAVIARSGIRPLSNRGALVDGGSIDVATVYLNSDQEFAVRNEADAHAYLEADPSHTDVWFNEETGEWMVRKSAGSSVKVPRKATLTRTVGGQIPDDFNPAHWGLPPSMIESLDRIAVWNLVSAVDAFISSGFTPAQILQAVHPAQVSSTQGTGIGGMESLRKVFLDRFLGDDRPQDILQEALPNVVAAHTMQAFIGGYGQMIHPVGACATAAISVEEGVDKILLGKSDFVVAGAIDDITVESLTGFGDMNATAESAALQARGISPRHFSRAGDRRRAGFLEAEGGGTILLARGSLAAQLGLPVLGVVAYTRSFADGAHTSIPAPGIGALAAGRGGLSSSLLTSLKRLGLTTDDIAVVSKHDTSTKANDPNEAELHSRLAAALGRSAGNPLHVISQKTVTGHAKGGAAVLQCGGLIDVFRSQVIPGNRSLDCLDPLMKPWSPLLWVRRPLDMSRTPVKAGVLTSLGFGHVSAVLVVTHPGAFEQALRQEQGEESVHRWRLNASRRLHDGRARFERAMLEREQLFEPIQGRRLPSGTHDHDVETSMLLDPTARLHEHGTF